MSNHIEKSDLYEQTRSPSPMPQHDGKQGYSPDQYPMDNMPTYLPPSHPSCPSYNQFHDPTNSRPYMSGPYNSPQYVQAETPLLNPNPMLSHNPHDVERIIVIQNERRSCVDRMCCGCLTCCPKWMRWFACTIFILNVIFAIIIGIIVGLFKVPTIQFTGYTEQPIVTYVNNVLGVSYKLGVSVNNTNFEHLSIEKIEADIYYPSPYYVRIGYGQVYDIGVNQHEIKNFTFPFSIVIDSNSSTQKSALTDLVNKCGSNTNTIQNIELDYHIYPTFRFFNAPVTSNITKTISIPCLLQGKNLTSLLGSNT
ncbi:hypothetical protein G6F36_012229 [Rhizopus arrhizus]|nr:hypothetical protein G6F36_012229 [Rhizopus arrhizus]